MTDLREENAVRFNSLESVAMGLVFNAATRATTIQPPGIRFGNTENPVKPEKPAPADTTKPVKKSWIKRNLNGTTLLWLAPLCNLIGGPLMIASATLPDKINNPRIVANAQWTGLTKQQAVLAQSAKQAEEPPKVIENQMGKFEQMSTAELQQTELDLTHFKNSLKWLGWEFCSLGFLGGAISGLAMGYISRQPGMALSSLSNIGVIPFLMMSPDSMALKAFVALSTAPWLTGYANIYRNQYQLKSGEKPREFDMAPLFNKEALQKMMQSEETTTEAKDITPKKLAKARRRHFWNMFKFMVTDQAMIAKDLKDSAKSAGSITKSLFTQPRQTIKSGFHQIRDAYRFIRGKSTDAPEILKPSVGQSQCAATLLYAGSMPILFVAGSVDSINNMGKALFTLGSALANIPMWAIGFNKKDNNLILGIPLMVGGTFTMDTDAGMGTMRLGEAGFMNYIRKEVAKGHQPSH